jgi:heme iron utilization protein
MRPSSAAIREGINLADKINPINETNEEARRLARQLIDGARFGALAVLDPETGAPYVSRVGTGTDAAGCPVILVSSLSRHTQGLLRNGQCSLLLGEPGKGEALTHPRVTLMGIARKIERTSDDHEETVGSYLAKQPKAQLYLGLGDFNFFRIAVDRGHLNGGFGKAFVLAPSDLGLPGEPSGK